MHSWEIPKGCANPQLPVGAPILLFEKKISKSFSISSKTHTLTHMSLIHHDNLSLLCDAEKVQNIVP